jgi:hypothetical protein
VITISKRRALLGAGTVVVAVAAALTVPGAVAAITPPTSVVVAVAGDIACDPTDTNFNGGAGTANFCHESQTANLVKTLNPYKVFAMGDTQYNNANSTQYAASYNPTWGQFKSKTVPVIGNHEYLTYSPKAGGYFAYFSGLTGTAPNDYRSFNITLAASTWHVVVINSECTSISSGVGCAVGSPQYNWLKNDLSANAATKCTVVLSHRPRWASDAWASSDIKPLVDLMGQYKVDLFLAGHAHNYERFAPQTAAGASSSTGIREIIVGTGGQDKRGFGTTAANSLVRKANIFGVLKLRLSDGGYSWYYTADPSTPASDSGSGTCT